MLETIWNIYTSAIWHFLMALIETAMFFAQFGILGLVALLSLFLVSICSIALVAKKIA